MPTCDEEAGGATAEMSVRGSLCAADVGTGPPLYSSLGANTAGPGASEGGGAHACAYIMGSGLLCGESGTGGGASENVRFRQ